MPKSRVYLIASPIGDHLADLSLAATRVLRKLRHLFVEADDPYIARLRAHDIIGPEQQLHVLDHPQLERAQELLAARESFAIVASSGIPCFVDPGREIVDLCLSQHLDEIELVPLGMSSALDAALCMCGSDLTFFRFNGHYPEHFLPPNKSADATSVVYFVRGHALAAFVNEVVPSLEPIRRLVVLKDLRKKGRARVIVAARANNGSLDVPEVEDDADVVCVVDRS